MGRSKTVAACLAAASIQTAPLRAAEHKLNWVKLADPPADLLGRECPPGMDATWVYVPPWKGFLLYGGFSPSYSNGGWFFHPGQRTWTLLWADDSLRYNAAKKEWETRLPREIHWSLDRPGPARGRGADYLPGHNSVLLLGGHPARTEDEGLPLRESLVCKWQAGPVLCLSS
jgi:hypothetical protein